MLFGASGRLARTSLAPPPRQASVRSRTLHANAANVRLLRFFRAEALTDCLATTRTCGVSAVWPGVVDRGLPGGSRTCY